jgi:NAD(P)-dependent dehydrogenase (short-subunit alcohol dehydrogenase family)
VPALAAVTPSKVAVVTGAADGIGLAAARRVRRAGGMGRGDRRQPVGVLNGLQSVVPGMLAHGGTLDGD